VAAAFGGIAAGDADRMLRHYTDDLVLELPYAQPPLRLEGREAVRAHLHKAFEVFRFSLEITAVHELVDADRLVLEYTSTGTVLTTGKDYANTYIGVYRFRDGAICGVREFYDPTAAARALQP
jgi:uncharacterized protein